ncbi:MAG: hypothetical protein H5T76_12560 [Streptomyces sp.]|uniref:hypothetical protein n=1 Tax=Quadrisphaera sp. GCM10027208 TaxID=3273423 RepID=UPI0019BF593A|nr:hypothetical protein [Streptomyces sp.]
MPYAIVEARVDAEAGLVVRRRHGRYTFLHVDTQLLRAIAKRWPPRSSQERP